MTTQPVPAIRVQGLEKSYKELRVLRGVDFDVALHAVMVEDARRSCIPFKTSHGECAAFSSPTPTAGSQTL